ncbi:hypothetical protein GCM10027614_42110 [Micromonospora vulcania]
MPFGRWIGQRRRYGGQRGGELGQQWCQGAGHRTEWTEPVAARPDGVQQHAQRERFRYVVALADEVASGQFGEQFGHQSALADAGLTLQQDQARRSRGESAQLGKLRRTSDELDGSAQARGAGGR